MQRHKTLFLLLGIILSVSAVGPSRGGKLEEGDGGRGFLDLGSKVGQQQHPLVTVLHFGNACNNNNKTNNKDILRAMVSVLDKNTSTPVPYDGTNLANSDWTIRLLPSCVLSLNASSLLQRFTKDFSGGEQQPQKNLKIILFLPPLHASTNNNTQDEVDPYSAVLQAATQFNDENEATIAFILKAAKDSDHSISTTSDMEGSTASIVTFTRSFTPTCSSAEKDANNKVFQITLKDDVFEWNDLPPKNSSGAVDVVVLQRRIRKKKVVDKSTTSKGGRWLQKMSNLFGAVQTMKSTIKPTSEENGETKKPKRKVDKGRIMHAAAEE
eukprot:PhF_6_TR37867/c1_g1_i6/m.56455